MEVVSVARASVRGLLVDAAVAQFHSSGFNAAGVKDITDSAGVPKGSFYNHFATKEALAVVALDRYGTSQHLDELSDPAIDGLQRLQRHFEFLRDEFVVHGYTRGCLLGNFGVEIADHSEIIRTAVREGFNAWSAAVAGAIAAGQVDGLIRADVDPDPTARFLISAWEGTLILARAEKSAKAFDIFFTLVFDTILR
jgi:TetR/AcrR family transcriptional repressor of nem operon